MASGARGDRPRESFTSLQRPLRRGPFALSATLLFLATGAPIAEARDQGALLLEIGERGLSLARCDDAAGLPPPAREALRAALALDPQARTPTARALADAMERGSKS